LIGNGEYRDPKLAALHAPTGDVHALRDVLADPAIGAFDVTSLVDADHLAVHKAIEGFLDPQCDPHDLRLLYITCHGIRSEARGSLNLAAADTSSDSPLSTTVSDRFVSNLMDECRAQAVVLILDCCYSGAFDSDTRGVLQLFDTSRTGRVVLMACSHLGYAFEDTENPGRGSLFTGYLVEGLRTGDADLDHDGLVPITELYEHTSTRMYDDGRGQLPIILNRSQAKIIVAKNPFPNPPPDGNSRGERPDMQLLAHGGGVEGVAFAGPRLLTTASDDGALRLFDLDAHPPELWQRTPNRGKRQARGLLAVAACPATGVIVTAGLDGCARRWDLTGKERPPVVHRRLRAVALSRNGAFFATAGDDSKARVRSTSTGELELLVYGRARLNAVAFSPDGTCLATAGDDHAVRVWDLRSEGGDPRLKVKHRARVWAVEFSTDGRQLATASEDQTARVWNLGDDDMGSELQCLSHPWAVWAVAFSSDGSRLATAGDSILAQVWDVSSGRRLASFPHDDIVWAVTFSPDSTHLATGSADCNARVWSV